MEFVEGETLNERIGRHGPVPERDVARLGIHIAHALTEAHRAGIVHRDLKPSNIYLVDPHRGSDFTAKVLDFGIAKVLTGLSAAEMVAFQTASPQCDRPIIRRLIQTVTATLVVFVTLSAAAEELTIERYNELEAAMDEADVRWAREA